VKVENFMLSGSFNSGFSLALMRKDLQTALNFIDRMGTSDDFVAVCTRTWTQAESELDKGADHTAMYKFIQERT
jgi:3-hydroxyisobutyrate dehydrogenase